MADLSTLDPTRPADTEQASQGASRIREERADLLGWAGVEHYLNGAHHFMSGDASLLPAPGNSGRIFLDTTRNLLLRDDGTQWRMLHTLPIVRDFELNSIPITIGPLFTTIASVTADLPIGGMMMFFGQFIFGVNANTTLTYRLNWVTGGAELDPRELVFTPTGPSGGFYPMSIFGALPAVNPGANIVNLEAHISTFAGATVSQRHLIGLIL